MCLDISLEVKTSIHQTVCCWYSQYKFE